MDDAVFELDRLHCDLADRTSLWRLGALLHSVSGYRQQNWRFDLDKKGPLVVSGQAILEKRQRIKLKTIQQRRTLHQNSKAA